MNMQPMKFGVGQPVRRKEDDAFLRGTGRYVADVSPDGALAAFIVRSPHAHARFVITDVTKARAMPGIHLVLTAADIDELGPLPCHVGLPGTTIAKPDYPVLAKEVAHHVGDAVAFVVADSLDQAKDAAEALAIDWAPLPAVIGAETALQPNAPRVWPDVAGNVAFEVRLGSEEKTKQAFDNASHVVSLRLINQRLVCNYLDTRGVVAEYEVDTDRITLTLSSQGSHTIRNVLCQSVLKIPPQKMRVITPDVGGGFGTKLFTYREYALAAVAAKRLRRAVKWVADRTEHFLGDAQGRDNVTTARLALGEDHRILALAVETVADMGAYLSAFAPYIPFVGAGMLPGVYDIPACHIRVRAAFTNSVPVDAYRGAGRPEAAYVIERLLDVAARDLGLAPDALRRRNFIKPKAMPYTTATGKVYDSGEFAAHMARAQEIADWKGFGRRLAQSKKAGKLRGIGLATYIEACGSNGPETATLKVEPDGEITVLIGSQSTGQGHHTAYAQLVSERLGVAPEAVSVLQGDTDRIATGAGTGGSSSIPCGGVAVERATQALADNLKALAADELEAAPSDLEITAGQVRVVGTDRGISMADLARTAPNAELLTAANKFAPAAATFPNGTHIVELEIDPDTGAVSILGYVVVDDVGVTLNPLMLAGQIHGGAVQGLGQALSERAVYDPDSGQLITATLMDYAIPHASDTPSFTFETRNVPCRTNPLGVKGAGEAGTIGACPAIMNAVVDALWRAFRIRHVDMPATPETLWRTIAEARRVHTL